MASREKKREIDPKPVCKYGANCYRRNSQHLEQFRHPKRKSEEGSENTPESSPSAKKKRIAEDKTPSVQDFFKPKAEPSTKESPRKAESITKDEDESPAKKEESEESESEESEEEEIEMPKSPEDVKENIKQKFLVEMPDDFYKFWEFCKSLNGSSPSEALKGTLGFTLVGPYDILAGRHKGVRKNRRGKQPNFLRHWRYYYDPPEFITVVKGDDDSQFHLGYFRDSPEEMPVFVAANSAKESCTIAPKGDNLFAAVKHYADAQLKSAGAKEKSKLKSLSEELEKWAAKHAFSLELTTKKMKARNKKVVCRSFHGAGVVVPVDDNEVGYRPVPETPADLKKMLKKIAESKTEKEKNVNFDPLQELITFVQFANDECDYGEGLELGLDLFSFGGDVFHSTILHLLPLAYQLLHRLPFAKVIQAHLKHRSHQAQLSELD